MGPRAWFVDFYRLARKAVVSANTDYVPSMGAAIAYYTVFSLAPLLVIVVAVAGFLTGRDGAQRHLMVEISRLVGPPGAAAVQSMLHTAEDPTTSALATGLGLLGLLIGATSVFAELQTALDRIWRVPTPPRANSVWALIRARLLSLGMILCLGFLSATSLILSAALTGFGVWWNSFFAAWHTPLLIANAIVGFTIQCLLFALIYKFLPRATIGWGDVWRGAVVTAVLFEIGKALIGLYLGASGVTSAFGAAGSFVVLLVWVYYSAQVFLLGAEFTWVYAREKGTLRDSGRQLLVKTSAASDIGLR